MLLAQQCSALAGWGRISLLHRCVGGSSRLQKLAKPFSTLDQSKNMSNTTFKKADLAAMVAEEQDMSKAKARRIVDSIFDTVHEELKKGNTVSIGGFGSFSIAKRASRRQYNIGTKEVTMMPESSRPKFTAYKALKDAVRA